MQFDDPKTGDLVIENLIGGLRNYGYAVFCTPVPGNEVEYADDLRATLKKVDQQADYLRRTRRLRGRSVRLLELLHETLPEPGFGVEASLHGSQIPYRIPSRKWS